jgi:hypothetical protein
MKTATTFSEILRLWPSAGELREDLAKHGCEASEVLIRRWWGDEMLPDRAWLALTRAAAERGHHDVTLERLATIATTDRRTRLGIMQTRAAAA